MIVLDLSLLFDDVLVCLPFCLCSCMAINVSVQYDGGLLPYIILLTQCYYHRGTRLNAMRRFLKKNQTTPRPSEHPPVMGGKMSKRLGGIKRLQIQNLFMAFKQVPRCR